MINSQRDPFLKERDLSLLEMCKNPSNKKKDDLPQWMFIDLIDPMQIRRNLLNYKNCHLLIIEFDNKYGKYVSIEAFAEKYKHLSWILHTTSSHTPEVHKFRVILPLDTPTAYSIWHYKTVQEEMQLLFEGIDPSSFSNFQKIPALPANPDDYRYIVNHGVKFSYSMIKDNVEARIEEENRQIAERARQRALRPKNESFNYEAYKAKVIENKEREFGGCGARETGDRYHTLCRYCGSLLNAKYPDGEYIFDDLEVKTIITAEHSDARVNKMVRDLTRRRK